MVNEQRASGREGKVNFRNIAGTVAAKEWAIYERSLAPRFASLVKSQGFIYMSTAQASERILCFYI